MRWDTFKGPIQSIQFDKYYKGQKGHGETKNDVMKEITALVI